MYSNRISVHVLAAINWFFVRFVQSSSASVCSAFRLHPKFGAPGLAPLRSNACTPSA